MLLSRLRHCVPHLAMLLLAVALYVAATHIDAGPAAGGRIGPDVWPKAIIVVMAALCLYEVIKRAVFGIIPGQERGEGGPHRAESERGDATREAARAEAPAAPVREHPGVLLGGAALIAAYVLLVSWLGFFVSTALFLAGFTRIGGFRRHGWNAVISLLGALLLVVIFMRVAYVSLPLGEGPFRALSIALMAAIGVH